jgi:methionyl-tRNA formyltransferase
MRVLFYGTPDFAVPSLMALVGEGFDVAGVVTRADQPTGRHRSTATPSPVKLAALAEEIPVFEPAKPNDDAFIARMREIAPDVAVVVAYGHILKPALLAVPRLGSFNVHASLLPKLRGAAPIERAILEGFTETGVSIMQMDAGLDTGPVLHLASTPIPDDETGGELRVRLAEIGALALIEALTLLDEAGITATPQDHARATYAPKLTREEERIDWTLDADVVARKIRAFDPKPGAWTEIRGKAVKVFGAKARREEGGRSGGQAGGGSAAGTVLVVGDTITIACGAGSIDVMDMQPAGKARMTAKAFVNGRGVAVGDVLT